MKKTILFAFVFSFVATSYSQYSWTQKANFPGTARNYDAGFTIGNYIYLGCGTNGSSYYNDFYRWNQVTNTWSTITSYPGAGYHFDPISFSIEGKGYVGLGWNGSAGATDLWRYDSTTNNWTQMASLPGPGRDDGSVFVIGHKAYLIGGSQGGPPYLEDVWIYDAHTNSWTQKGNSPAGKLDALITFSIGNHGYIGGGFDGSGYYRNCWEYDTTSDTWTSIATFPLTTGISGDPRTFVLGSKAYVCTGTTVGVKTLSDGYAYDTVIKAWSVFTNMGVNKIERGYAAAFTIGNKGYIATGRDSLGVMLNDLWQWGPIDTTTVCDVWTQKANFPGTARNYDAGFTIGNYIYLGCGTNGSSYYNDFYRWNQVTNTWSTITSYPGAGYHFDPISFSIEGKGYVGLGWNGSAGATDLWRYDSTTNNWTQMASLPGPGRDDGSVFVIGHKAYLIGGSQGGPPYLEDVWIYDAHTNSWTQKGNSPAGKLDALITFSIGNHGYIGGGFDGSGYYRNCWEYDTTSDTWTSIATFPLTTGISGDPRTFVLGSKAYVCTGTTVGVKTLSDGYAYDTVIKAWSVFTNMGVNKIERGYAAAFTLGKCGFIATGRDSLGVMLNDLWKYCPCADTAILTGTRQYDNTNFAFKLYPNPSSGNLTIKYSVLNAHQVEFRVIDMFGRLINSVNMDAQTDEMTINETSLGNGMYFYQVLDSGKLISSGKFIIAK